MNKFFNLISQKPWEPSQVELDNIHNGKTLNLSREKLGVRAIMVISTIIFSFFIVAYGDRMIIHDWKSMPEPWLLWINTAILIVSSYIFHKTKKECDNNNSEKVKNGLFAVGFFTLLFLLGQTLVWFQFLKLGYYASSNVANAFFYLLTALHGLHLLGGLIFWGLVTSKFLKGKYKIVSMQHSIELCAIYWHFLLFVWFVLFGLMLFT